MLQKLFKKGKTDASTLVAKKPDEDFIPYVCHYDKNTILTKNGELLQIIRITGFSDDSIMSEVVSLRDNIRDSIVDHIKENKFAFWFHTIRRRKNIVPKGKFTDFLSKEINDEWIKENKWSDQYVNELYVTIIIEGLDTSIVNFNAFLRSFSYFTTRSLHQKHLQEAHKKLSKTVTSILVDIEEYGAKLLGISEWEGVLYSEPLRFFGKIVNLYEERYPLSVNDMSSDLASHKIAFGDRELEVIGNKNKNFAAILSLKEYQETPIHALDHVLQLPFEYIVAQSFDFTFSRKEIEPYEYQDYILQVSDDSDFRTLIGSDHFVESNTGSETDYGKLQTTFMFIAKNKEALEKDIKNAMEELAILGLVVVREDIFTENCFWAQLPANFRFLNRQKVISASRMGGFAALHNFPSGLIAGNHWGPAVTVLKTVLNTPYFFNFHEKDLGHTLILGPKGSGKTVLTNFMLTQARKFNNKIFYFDLNLSSKCFIKALCGQYYKITHDIEDPELLELNPFSLSKSSDNKSFLSSWFASLVAFSKNPMPQEEIGLIPQVVDRIFDMNVTNFGAAFETFNSIETKNIYEKLKIWGNGKLSHIFGAAEEISWDNPITAFDFTDIIGQKPIIIPVVTYLLHKIESKLDGSPAIIVLDEAWNLINNEIFSPQIVGFLSRMRKKNCVVIFTSSDIEAVGSTPIISDIRNLLAGEIFLPNSDTENYYRTVFGLNGEEVEIVKMMESEKRHLLLKHRGDTIIASLDLSKFARILEILSSNQVSITVVEEVIAHNIDDSGNLPSPDIWIPQAVEILEQIEKERLEEERKKAIERTIQERKLREKMED